MCRGMKTTSSFETLYVSTDKVTCDGSGGPLGHPRVFLHIDFDAGGQVVCPYCSRTFVFKTPDKASA